MSAGLKIAVPTCTSTDLEYNRRSWPMYAAAIRESGATPVEVGLQLSEGELVAVARTCHGILLPGSPADVDPARYGRVREPACASADLRREIADRLLLEDAFATAKPVLGICYGAQSINVWSGGSLVQDVRCLPVNHAAGAGISVAHSAIVRSGTILASVVDSGEAVLRGDEVRLPINSSHHQAVEHLGENLRVSAVSAEDGVIEAVEAVRVTELPNYVVGVQWHPERSIAFSGTSRALFLSFVCAVRERWQGSLAFPVR